MYEIKKNKDKKGACISGVIRINNDNRFNRDDSGIYISKSIIK